MSKKQEPQKPEPLKPEIDHSFDREVAQDVRQEQVTNFFKRYGGVLAVGIALVVGGVGYYQWQQVEQKKVNEEASVVFDQFLKGNGENEIVKDAKGYALLSNFVAAGKSADKYDTIINDNSVPELYREQATVLAGYAALEAELPAELKTKLQTIEISTSAWQYLAREVLALDAYKRNENGEAVSYLLALTEDNTASESVRNRASELLPLVKVTDKK